MMLTRHGQEHSRQFDVQVAIDNLNMTGKMRQKCDRCKCNVKHIQMEEIDVTNCDFLLVLLPLYSPTEDAPLLELDVHVDTDQLRIGGELQVKCTFL